MLATVILGIAIAIGFGFGLKTIYNNFFKGEAECCKAECGGNCACCRMKEAHHH